LQPLPFHVISHQPLALPSSAIASTIATALAIAAVTAAAALAVLTTQQ